MLILEHFLDICVEHWVGLGRFCDENTLRLPLLKPTLAIKGEFGLLSMEQLGYNTCLLQPLGSFQVHSNVVVFFLLNTLESIIKWWIIWAVNQTMTNETDGLSYAVIWPLRLTGSEMWKINRSRAVSKNCTSDNVTQTLTTSLVFNAKV